MPKVSQFAIFLAFAMFSLMCSAGPERIYKWVDTKGETHYGHTIPPEYSDRDRYEIDKTGRIVKKTNILNADERVANRAAEAKQQEEKDHERDRALRDKALLNTYSNVKEIDLARARNLQQVEARAQVAGKQLASAKESFESLRTREASFAKSGKPVPTYLREDINDAQLNLDKMSKEYAKLSAEKSALEARYDEDKARYKLLTGK